MLGRCLFCSADLDALAREGKVGHVCSAKPDDHGEGSAYETETDFDAGETQLATAERRYITLHMGPSADAPTIDLLKGAGQRIVVLAERAEPQPPGLPDGIVAIVLPNNCYIDTSDEG